jgi:phosphate:Na+ symporter
VVSLHNAAAAVIGAAPSAKRVAAAHMLFNVVVAIAALALLPAGLWLVAQVRALLSLDDNPAATLGVFHTVSKLLGVAMMAPLTSRLVPLLERRFRTREEDEGRPRHLDQNVLATPTLALDALTLELARIGARSRAAAATAISGEDRAAAAAVAGDRRVVERLVDAVGRFSAAIQRANLPAQLDQLLPEGLRVARRHLAPPAMPGDGAAA